MSSGQSRQLFGRVPFVDWGCQNQGELASEQYGFLLGFNYPAWWLFLSSTGPNMCVSFLVWGWVSVSVHEYRDSFNRTVYLWAGPWSRDHCCLWVWGVGTESTWLCWDIIGVPEPSLSLWYNARKEITRVEVKVFQENGNLSDRGKKWGHVLLLWEPTVSLHSLTSLLLYLPGEQHYVCVPSSGYPCRGRSVSSLLTYGVSRAPLRDCSGSSLGVTLSCFWLASYPPVNLSSYQVHRTPGQCPGEHIKEARACAVQSDRGRGIPLWWLSLTSGTLQERPGTHWRPVVESLLSDVHPQKSIDHRFLHKTCVKLQFIKENK